MNPRVLSAALSIIALAVIIFAIGRKSATTRALQEHSQIDATKHDEPTVADRDSTSPAVEPDADSVSSKSGHSDEDGREIDQLNEPRFGAPTLTREQIRFIQRQYEIAVKQREQIEVKLAQAEPYIKGQVLITIPPYAKEGQAIYNQFAASLQAELGQPLADKFLSTTGKSLVQGNRGFGEREQNILIEDTGTGYNVTHGSEKTGSIVGQSVVITSTSTGILPYTNLSGYSYLQQFFPKEKL